MVSMTFTSYQQLILWRRSMDLVAGIYRVSRRFPSDERSGLTATLRRTATVVPGKIADGHGRSDFNEAMSAFAAAQGALRELLTHLIVARRLHFISWLTYRLLRLRCKKLYSMLDLAIEEIEDLNREPESDPSLKIAA